MSNTIRVLVVRPDQEPTIEEIGTDLGALQAVVGGSLELLRVTPAIDCWLNEEGVLEDESGQPRCPFNRYVLAHNGIYAIHGTFFFACHDGEGEMAQLSEEQLDACRAMLRLVMNAEGN